MRPVREITAEMEGARFEPVLDGRPGLFQVKRCPIEPEPIGTLVASMWVITGYDKDCDGSLMARLDAIGSDGAPTGWSADCIGLCHDNFVVLDSADELHKVAEGISDDKA